MPMPKPKEKVHTILEREYAALRMEYAGICGKILIFDKNLMDSRHREQDFMSI